MKRLALAAMALIFLTPVALAQSPNDDDSALVASGDDDSAMVTSGNGDSSALAVAADGLPVVSDEQASEALSVLMDAKSSSGWGILAAAILSLLIFGGRKTGLLKKVPKKSMPWLAAVVAMLADFLTAIIAGGPVLAALAHGFMLGAGAVGFWELVLQHGLKDKLPIREPKDVDQTDDGESPTA